MTTTTDTAITVIAASQLAALLQAGALTEFWNVLVPEYFTGELIPGSRHVPVPDVGAEVRRNGLAREAAIVVYCSGPTCPNSRQAAAKLAAFGFTNVALFEGGLEEWKEEGYETSSRDPRVTRESRSA